MIRKVAVAGLGVVGAAAAAELSRRGVAVVGFDRWRPPHDLGSSHGGTRIIREAYFEHPLYVPLVRRARDSWRELERRSGRSLMRETGGLNVGPPEGELVRGALASAKMHGIPHEVLSAEEIETRWPGLRAEAGMVGVLEPRAGVLFPEACVEALHEDARAAGAELRVDERVESWRATAEGIEVVTERGVHVADRLVLAAGGWLTSLVPDLGLPLEVERQVMSWYGGDARLYGAERCPVTLWETRSGALMYTCPDLGEGVKVGIHHGGRVYGDAEGVERSISSSDVAEMNALVAEHLPELSATPDRSRVCLYTNTPDRHFVIDVHPGEPRVVIASACSGHGFKFGPAVAERIAELVRSGERAAPDDPFRLGRLCG